MFTKEDPTDEIFKSKLAGSQRRYIKRAEDRYYARRAQKGNRAFHRAERRRAFDGQTAEQQMWVLDNLPQEHPMYVNVFNHLVRKYGPQIEQMVRKS